MNPKFDPITGQLITEENNANPVGFDPITGQPFNGTSLFNAGGFDPMTGSAVTGGNMSQDNTIRFDPITGQLISESNYQYGNTASFDPLTGQPNGGNQKGFKLPKDKIKMKLGLPIIIGVAAIAVVGIIVAILIFSGAFLSKQNKVLIAAANTFKDSTALTETLEGLGILASDSFTLSGKIEVEGEGFQGSFASKDGEMQLSGKVDISGAPEIEGVIGVDSKAVRARIDGFTDYMFVYNYTGKNSGYLMELAEDYGYEDEIEMLNSGLKNLTTKKNRDEIVKELGKVCLKEFNKWEIQKASKEEFEVNGKDRKCKGYTLTITEDNMLDFIGAVSKVIEKEVEIDEIEHALSELEYEFEDMPDIEATFYIYDNMLAAIILEVDKEEIEVLFQGGEARWQNTVVKYEKFKVLEIEGKTTGSVEKYTVRFAEDYDIDIEYNKKSGALEVEASEEYRGNTSVYTFAANVKGNADQLTVVLDSYKENKDKIDLDMEFTLQKGAKFNKISGKEFDLGNADEDDFEDLIDDVMDYMY